MPEIITHTSWQLHCMEDLDIKIEEMEAQHRFECPECGQRFNTVEEFRADVCTNCAEYERLMNSQEYLSDLDRRVNG